MRLQVYFVTPDGAPDALILAALRGGAHVIQLRDKTATDAQMLQQALRLKPAIAAAGALLIINDRLSVALASGADGLHIGQGDGDPLAARMALGPDRILGLSIETLAQVPLIPPGVDYIGAGPLRATATKPDHAQPLGMAGLAQIVAASPVPVVAIGGLALPDALPLRAMGCAGMALVSAIASAPDPEAATKAFVTAWSLP